MIAPLLALAACTPDPAPEDPQPPHPTAETGLDPLPTACDQPAGFDAVQIEPMSPQIPGATIELALDAPEGITVTCELLTAPPRWILPVPLGSSWRTSPPGATPNGWEQPGFDDTGWALQAAPLGFGTEVTSELAPATTAFRTTFEVVDPGALSSPTLATLAGGDLRVYLNGAPVAHLPRQPGPPDALRTLPLEASALQAGTNTLAVLLSVDPGDDVGVFELRLAAELHDALEPEPERHVLHSPEPQTHHALQLFGLLADASYTCEATTACGSTSAPVEVHTGPLPLPPPPLALAVSTEDVGYTLFNHQRRCAEDYTNRLYVVDPQGRVRWSYELQGLDASSSVDIESIYLGDGTFLWGGGEQPEGHPQIVGLDHVPLHTAAFEGSEALTFHHDIEWLPERQILGFVDHEVVDGDVHWEGFDLIQYAADTQQITWSWSTQAAYDAGQLPPGSASRRDPYHANSLAVVDDADGPGIYVTLLRTEQIVRIDRATGDLTWTLGRGGDFALLDADGQPLPDEAWFDAVHAIDAYGPDRFLLYSNGRDTHRSEVMEFVLDVPARTATLTWAWSEPGWYEPYWGDADELPSGDVLVAMAHNWCSGGNRAHPGALVQVQRPSDQVVWRLDFLDSDDTTYRAQRIDGCDLFANQRYCPSRR